MRMLHCSIDVHVGHFYVEIFLSIQCQCFIEAE
jgi:hypothetical protein